jgi:hypothetical protein
MNKDALGLSYFFVSSVIFFPSETNSSYFLALEIGNYYEKVHMALVATSVFERTF